jgi:hypothetical protein
MDLPALSALPTEQLHLASGAGVVHQIEKLLRLAGMLTPRGFDHSGMIAVQEHWPTSRCQHAVLGLTAQPLSDTHPVLYPGQQRLEFEEIKAMPVRDIADDNAILWLWTTNAHLHVAFDVVAAWDFAVTGSSPNRIVAARTARNLDIRT